MNLTVISNQVKSVFRVTYLYCTVLCFIASCGPVEILGELTLQNFVNVPFVKWRDHIFLCQYMPYVNYRNLRGTCRIYRTCSIKYFWKKVLFFKQVLWYGCRNFSWNCTAQIHCYIFAFIIFFFKVGIEYHTFFIPWLAESEISGTFEVYETIWLQKWIVTCFPSIVRFVTLVAEGGIQSLFFVDCCSFTSPSFPKWRKIASQLLYHTWVFYKSSICLKSYVNKTES